MKRIIFLTVAAATLLLTASCQKTETDTTSDKVIVNINVAGLAPETKAVKTGWSEGDKINIWFNDVPAGHYSYWKELPHLVLTYTAGAWTGSDVDVDLLSASGTFKAIYEASNAMFTSVIDSQYAYYPDGTKFKFFDRKSGYGKGRLQCVMSIRSILERDLAALNPVHEEDERTLSSVIAFGRMDEAVLDVEDKDLVTVGENSSVRLPLEISTDAGTEKGFFTLPNHPKASVRIPMRICPKIGRTVVCTAPRSGNSTMHPTSTATPKKPPAIRPRRNCSIMFSSQMRFMVKRIKTTKSALLRSADRRYHDVFKGKGQTAAGRAAP